MLSRISAQLDDAAGAVTAFWGPDWPHDIVVAAASTDAQFAAVGGGDPIPRRPPPANGSCSPRVPLQ